MLRAVCLILVFCGLGTAQSYTISTVAGGGVGDGELATNAALAPYAVATDSSGNLYIAEKSTNRVRKVTAATGIITTVAGNGTPGFSGDGGPAVSATLRGPSGVAVDYAGNIYIADFVNNVVREVAVATGTITTLAGSATSRGYYGDGGLASAAGLNGPRGVTTDSAGNLYIADSGNHSIRKVTAATGIITTVAGNGSIGYTGDGGPATSATLNNPGGVATDLSGNIYIADAFTYSVRKVAAGSGVITTIYGIAPGCFSSTCYPIPDAVTADSAGNVYIAQGSPSMIEKLTAGTGNISTVAISNLNNPTGVATDSSGNLYIADMGLKAVLEVAAATGTVTTVAGGGGPGGQFGGDGGLATNAALSSPPGVATDASGNVYIADALNSRVRKVAASTGIITTVAGPGTAGVSGDGGPAVNASLFEPEGVALDSSGNIFIADLDGHLRKVTAATGIITTIAGGGYTLGDGGLATSSGLFQPSGVAVDSAGNLYIADTQSQRIREVAAATGIIITVAGNGISGFSGDGGVAVGASLSNPTGVAVDSAGNLYIADEGNSLIRKVAAATGIITTVAGTGAFGFSGDGGAAISAGLWSPGGVAVDSNGNLFIADSFNARIREVAAATGIITTIAGNGSFGFGGDGGAATSTSLSQPKGVALDSSGNIYIADTGNNRIRKLMPTTGQLVTITVAANPAGLSLTVDGTVTGTPQTFSWLQGSTHTLFAPNQTTASGLRYTFSSWSQGGTASQGVTVSGAVTYTANFQLLPPTISCPPGSGLAVVAALYTINCTASDGVAPYAWSITAGALPPGLALNAATGVITGNPTTAGLYSFTVQAVDSNRPPQSATLNVGFQVVPVGTGCVTTGTSTATPTTDGGVGYVAITSAGSCAWTAVSNVAWVTLYPGANTGTGNGTLPYFVTPNVSSLARSGTLSINGVTFTIDQPGLNASINERFVRLLYRNFLGRLPDSGGLAYWKGLLDSNQYTKEQLGYFFFTAPEFDAVERFTAGQYVGILGRDADYAGWNFHRTNIRDGLYGADYQGYITNLFLGSAEYAAKYGNPSDSQFITLLYQNALARTPAPSEVTGWQTTLASTTRVQVAEDFLNSQEFLNGQNNVLNVELLYFAFLSRDPDASGFTFWLSYVQAAPLSTVVGDFVDSAEFQGLIGP